jgi:hypothetical protein
MIVAHPQHILATGAPSLGPQVRLLIRSFTLPRWRYTEEMTKTGLAERTLSALAAGMGTLMMGVLNQPGYNFTCPTPATSTESSFWNSSPTMPSMTHGSVRTLGLCNPCTFVLAR